MVHGLGEFGHFQHQEISSLEISVLEWVKEDW